MDVQPLVQKAKCKKLNEGEDVRRYTRLCELPDDVLWHILSFLQQKEVVRMSALSKRWEYLSRNTPRLDVEERDFPGPAYFANFLDRALLLHDFPLKRFTILCKTLYDRSQVDAWITAAIKRKVEELHVKLDGGIFEYVLPSCVFNSQTLIELHLSIFHELRLPSSVCLKNLKVLTLDLVEFGGDSSVEELLSCPSLEELSLTRCEWRRLKVLRIYAPKLLSLDIEEDLSYDDTGSSLYLEVHGARIKSFTYIGQFADRYSILSSSFLAVASIYFWMLEWPQLDDRAYHAYKLLKNVSDVKSLSLLDVDEFLNERPDLLMSLPVFCHLTKLELYKEHNLQLESRFLAVILHKCPRLSHLKFTRGIYADPESVVAIFYPAPQCFLSSLKVIEIHNFVAGDKSFSAIKILLSMGGVLKKLFVRPPSAKQLPRNLLQQLNELPRASDQCKFFLVV